MKSNQTYRQFLLTLREFIIFQSICDFQCDILLPFFVSRGLEYHHQLRIDSFDFKVDEEGLTYACLKHETTIRVASET